MYNWQLRKRTFLSPKAADSFIKNYPGKLSGYGFEGRIFVLHFRLPF